MSNEYYIWPIVDLAVAQMALSALNGDERLPIVGKNAKTGQLEPDKQKTTIWTEEVQIFVNDTCGFPRMTDNILSYLNISEEEKQAFLDTFNPSIIEFDSSWLPPIENEF